MDDGGQPRTENADFPVYSLRLCPPLSAVSGLLTIRNQMMAHRSLEALVSAIVGSGGELLKTDDSLLIKELQHWLAAEAASRAMAPRLGLVFFAALDADVSVQGVIERLAREIDPKNCDRLQQVLHVASEHGGHDEGDLAEALDTYLRASYYLGQFNGWRLAQQIGGAV